MSKLIHKARQLAKKIYLLFPYSGRKKIRGKNNRIECRGAILRGGKIDIVGDNNLIEIEPGCMFRNVRFHVRGNNHRILFKKSCRFHGGGDILLEDENCTLTVGENTTFENVHLAITEPGSKITIGDDCMFAYDVDVRTGDSHSILSTENEVRLNFAEDVFIGNHVWVAAHVILLKGTQILENSVVATGSVVTGKFNTPGIVLAGNPARQKKEGITWSRKRVYE